MSSRKPTTERQEEILEASLKIIHEQNTTDLTIRNLAEAIDVSEAAIYRHFYNKEEIIRGIAEKVFERDRLPSPRELEKSSDPEKLLQSLLKSVFESIEEKPEITSVIFQTNVFGEYPEVERLFRSHRRKKKKKLIKRLRVGQKIGLLSKNIDPETAATIIMGSIRLTVLEWREDEFKYSLSDQVQPLSKELARLLAS